MATKKKNLGKVIANVQGMKVRQIQEFTGRENDRKVSSTTISIFRGKNMVESGFKNKQEAMNRASILVNTKNKL